MRLTLLTIVLFFGGLIGINAIQTVSQLQDAKLQQFCKEIPREAGEYQQMCGKFE